MLQRVRRDWGKETLAVNVQVNSDRANLAGLTNQDVAGSSQIGLSGYRLDVLREGDKQIPIVARMRAEESSEIQGLSDMYIICDTGVGACYLAIAVEDLKIISWEPTTHEEHGAAHEGP